MPPRGRGRWGPPVCRRVTFAGHRMFDGRAPALARRTPRAYTVEGARGRGRPRTDRRWTGRRAGSRTAPADRDETARAWGMGSRPTDGRGQADDEADRTGRRE